MPKLRKLKGRDFVKLLRRYQIEVMLTQGSHHFLRDPDGRCTVVPVHAGETLGPGLLLQILRDTELTKDDLR